jgi:hypothetical protein
MNRIIIQSALSACILVGPAVGRDDEGPLIPEPESLLLEDADQDLRSTVRMLENVVESARSTRSQAVERNMTYNERRRETLIAELDALEEGAARLDDAVGLQFEKIREKFGGEIPAEYLDWVRQMKRQHKVARDRLQSDIADRRVELAEVEQRISDGAVEREVARIEQELAVPFEPADFLDPARTAEPETADDEMAYLQDLARRRLRARVLAITDPQPMAATPGALAQLVTVVCP